MLTEKYLQTKFANLQPHIEVISIITTLLMLKLQQYTFVCAPQPAQWAGAVALDVEMQPYVDAYRRKRDLLVEGLRDKYELTVPGGAFYAFPKVPHGTATEFVAKAIENNLLVIPGGIFKIGRAHV